MRQPKILSLSFSFNAKTPSDLPCPQSRQGGMGDQPGSATATYAFGRKNVDIRRGMVAGRKKLREVAASLFCGEKSSKFGPCLTPAMSSMIGIEIQHKTMSLVLKISTLDGKL